ncbi:MAG: hypothetical protein AB7F41_16720 [Methylocystis sp.]|uniref:hypothetical protein n=1 Tax=Methylocystis sp. TaxID=1911079 RepID=UPI003D10D720
MVAVSRFAAYAGVCAWLIAGVAPALAASGEDFPNVICACKKCGPNKSDVVGKCPDVCKEKTVYNKGDKVAPPAARTRSGRRDRAAKNVEPTEFCKASRMKLPKGWMRADPPPARAR